MPLIDQISTALLMAFWGRIEKGEGDDSCWIWTGATNPGKNGKPYGYVSWDIGRGGRTHLYAHRVAYVLKHGIDYADIVGKDVHHSCPHSLCVNPAHLEAVKTSTHALISNLARWKEEGECLKQVQAAEDQRLLSGLPKIPQPDSGV